MLKVIDAHLGEVARHVFATMLKLEADASEPSDGDGQPAPFMIEGIAGCIGFAGTISGTLFFCLSDALAEKLAHMLLGELCPVGPREISDVTGELTNMVAGGCKSRLCDGGYPVVMSIPNIIRGQQIRAHSRDVSFQVKRRIRLPALDSSVQLVFLGKVQ